MRLEAGARLGPYEIEAALGAGGMGEVYRARDTRLDRSVAIKVLPAEFSADESVRARFEREARTISSLTHPHICTLHDVGKEGDVDYLVMELLEGESLADRLTRGALPLDEAVRFGIQIAGALDRAHRSGVVHRDLKPGNVMLTSGGAKLLDFGLAKPGAIGPAQASSLTALPTEARPLTQEGTILGTFQYMAPEQLEGQEADARTDIFSFGALLYEMVTGQRAFSGKSKVSLIASIMEHEPQPITAHQPLSPPALDRLIRQCLKKDADDRWQTAHDLSLQLRWIEEGGSQAGIPATVVARRKFRERGSWLVAALAGAAALAFAALWQQAIHAPAPLLRTSILPAEMEGYSPGDGVVLSPAGDRLVYVADADTRPELWVRELGNDEAQPLRGSEGASYPFWSPDGRDIGFFADARLKRISVSGGGARSLAEAAGARGGSWGDDGWIVYAPSSTGPLMRVAAAGGPASEITKLDQESRVSSHRWPWLLPGGRRLLYLAQTDEGGTTDDQSAIRVLDLDSGEDRKLLEANSSMQYAATGHLLYWSQGSLLAQPFDAAKLELAEAVAPVAEGVLYTANEYAAFSQASNGLLLFQKGSAIGGLSELVWTGADGARGSVIRGPDQYYGPALSPDDRRLAVEMGNDDLWVLDLERGSSSRLTFEGGDERSPVWSADGEWIYYGASVDGKASIRRKRASGVGSDETVADRPSRPGTWAISRDGRQLIFAEANAASGWDLWLLDLETREASVLIATPYLEVWATFGPTAEWIAYTSDESGSFEVYAQRIAGDGGRWQISTNGGSKPIWSRDGKTIYFLRGDAVLRVEVEAGESLRAGIPEKAFDIDYRDGPFGPYALTSDGKRFVFVSAEEDSEAALPMTLVQNWTRLLER